MGGEDLGPYGTHYHMGGPPLVSGVEREGGEAEELGPHGTRYHRLECVYYLRGGVAGVQNMAAFVYQHVVTCECMMGVRVTVRVTFCKGELASCLYVGPYGVGVE